MTSVNTNFGALVALQQLNTTNRDLSQVQNRISTGLRVSSARDDGAVFAIGQGQRARLGTIDAVRRGLDRANVVIDTGLTAGERIGNVLAELRTIAEDGQSDTFSTEQRNALQARFSSLRTTINTIANSATFNGQNVINGSTSQLRVAIADSAGTASGGQAAGQFARTTAIATSALTLDSDIDDTAFGGVASTQGLGAGDVIAFNFTDSDTSFSVTIASGDTLSDVIDRINTNSGGRLTASFDEDNQQLVYQSNDAFSVAVTESGTADADAGVLSFFGDTSASTTFVAGGGFQASGAQLSSRPNSFAELGDLAGADFTGGNIAIVLAGADEDISATTDNTTFNIEVNGTDTIDDVLNRISSTTGGAVTARYDAQEGRITYQSQSDFSVAASSFGSGSNATATLNFFDNNSTLGGTLAPDSSGSGLNGSNSVSVKGFDFRTNSASGPLKGFDNLRVDDAASSATAAAQIDKAIVALNDQLANLGAQGASLDTQNNFLVTLRDQVNRGLGQLVDADLANESARLQSLQVRQQLGTQSLSIANQQPQLLLSLFR